MRDKNKKIVHDSRNDCSWSICILIHDRHHRHMEFASSAERVLLSRNINEEDVALAGVVMKQNQKLALALLFSEMMI